MSGRNEPVNLLACDGGGIRGVSELVILDEVMRRIQQKGNLAKVPKPCDYFHLIGGTSTGGLVAIMLGRLEMSTEEALTAYDSFASAIFSKRRWSVVEKYRAKALEKSVKKLVRDQGKGLSMRDARPKEAKGHAFVCTMPEQRHKEMVCLRTYEATGDKYPDCLIVEAARATTAATTYFRPMPIKDNEDHEEMFVDAALGTNNPISILWDEAMNLFGKKRKLGCVVSLGTGSRDVELDPKGDWMIEKVKYAISAIKIAKEIGTDSEKDHQRWKTKFEEFEHTYFRLNVDGGAQGIELSDWKKIEELKRRTRKYLQDPVVDKSIDDLAEVLLNSRDSGLTLAHGGGLSKDITIPAEPRNIRRGKSSNIFTGRTAILERLDRHFGPRAPGDTSRREFHLRGMGGMGKTQIALKFTERNDRRFHILWVDATDAVTIQQGYKQMASSIFGPAEREDPVQDVLNYLQRTDEEWLLIFDNAPVSSLARYLPDGDRGNILYTSRHRNLQPRLRPDCVADIEEMDIQDSVLLLLRSAQQTDYTDESRQFAKQIVRALGLLPLAIDQAGAYMHMAPCPLDEYLSVYNEQKETLLRSPRFRGGDDQRHIAVYATFNISYKAIKAFADKREDMDRVKDADAALKLLNLFCFYSNEGAFHRIFGRAAKARYRKQRGSEHPLEAGDVNLEDLIWTFETEVTPETPDGREWDSNSYVGGLSFLSEFSLIKSDSSTFYSNMHVLVHDWARYRMGDKERSEWGFAARCLLLDSISLKSNSSDRGYRTDIASHMDKCRKFVAVESDDVGLESEYHYKIARVCEEAGYLKGAESAMTKAVEYRKITFGLLHPYTFSAMSRLAGIYEKQGRYSEAEGLLREVIDRRMLSRRELKWEAINEAQRAASEDNSKDKVVIPDADDPLDDPRIMDDTKMLSSILIAQDQREASVKIWLEIKEWYERRDGSDRKVRLYQKLVRWMENGNQEDDGSLTVQEAIQQLADSEALFGPFHHITMQDKIDLAEALGKQGDGVGALRLYVEVTEWTEKEYGSHDMRVFRLLDKMARTLAHHGRAYEADELYLAIATCYNDLFGPRHPDTLKAKVNRAVCLYSKTMYEEAISLIQECLEAQRVVLGPQHTLTLQSEHCLRQFRETQATAPDWLRASIRNKAIQTSIDALGDRAPEWMRQWTPEPEEELMRAHLERGTLRRLKLDIATEAGGLVFTRLQEGELVGQPRNLERRLEAVLENDGEQTENNE